MELQFPNMYDATMKGYEDGKQNRLQRLLQQNAGPAINGDQGALAKLFQADPASAMKVQQYGQQQQDRGIELDDNKRQRLGQHAAAILKAPPAMRSAMYRQILPELQQVVPGDYPPDWNDAEMTPMAEKIAQAFGGAKDSEEYTLTPGSARFRGNQQIAAVPVAPSSANYVDVPDGNGGTVKMLFDPRTRQFSEPDYSGGQSSQQPQDNGASAGLDQPDHGAAQMGDPNKFYASVGDIVSPFGGSIGSTTGGQHNPGSQHPKGNAVDIPLGDWRNIPPAQQEAMKAKLEAGGYKVLDERTRPQGQAVWGGPHLHVERPQGQQGGGRMGHTPPKQEKPQFQAKQYGSQEIAQMGLPPGTVAYTSEDGTPKIVNKPDAKAADASGGAEAQKQTMYAKNMAQDAIAFAAAFTGISQAELAKLSPEQVRDTMIKHDRATAGPIIGSLPGMGKFANADLEAYSNSASGKQARINNPTGPVTNADFEVARKSVFSADKPLKVNADLVFQALLRAKNTTQLQAAPPANGGFRILPD